MPFQSTPFEGLFVFEPVLFQDSRGYFFESYNSKAYAQQGIETVFVQDNQSRSGYGVIRGLHFQKPPFAQAKLVRVLQGAILDVVVDIRVSSPTFGKTYSVELSDENRRQLYIPKGFAHGFSVLSSYAEILYKCDTYYHKESEAGIRFDDPSLGIDWKVPPGHVIVSEKDALLPLFDESKEFFK